VLGRYRGPEIPRREWEEPHLHDLRDRSGPFFAPVTSETGQMELKGFREYGKADLEGAWTQNATKCPMLVR
jgi:hypothetical protein